MASTRIPKQPGRQAHWIIITICALIAIPAAVVMFWVSARQDSPWFGKYDPNAREAYDIQLTDQSGAPFRLGDLRGDVVLVNFGFTHCPNICPSTLAGLANVVRRLPPGIQEQVRVVFITVDPERDTPERLKAFVPFFDQRFIGLTGDPAQIAAAAKAYGAYFKKTVPTDGDPAGYMLDHSSAVYVIDPERRFRMLYRFDQLPDSESIADDIIRLVRQTAPPAG